MGFTKSK